MSGRHNVSSDSLMDSKNKATSQAVASVCFLALCACAEVSNGPQPSLVVDKAVLLPVEMPRSYPGEMVSGLEAYENNWRRAYVMASLGDSTGLRAMLSLQKLAAQVSS